MAALRVGVVGRDSDLRLAAARAFDAAPSDWSITLHRDAPGDDLDVVVRLPDANVPGAVEFDPENPARILDDVARVAATRTRVVVVTSPAGGSGVTSIALHIASALSDCCFVDLDCEWGAARRLGLAPDEVRTWADARDGDRGFERSCLPVAGGFRALLSPGTSTPFDPGLVECAVRHFAHVVLDVPGARASDAILDAASTVVLVVTPSRPAAQRAREILRARSGVRWAIVTNRLGPGSETTRAEIERILGRRVAVELPCCPSLRDAEDVGRLTSLTWTRWGRRVVRLARALEDS